MAIPTTSAHSALPAPPLPSAPGRYAVMLDADRILPGVSDAENAGGVSPALSQLLADLHQLTEGALALLSARELDDIGQLFGRWPGAVAALHGLELRHADGSFRRRQVASESQQRMHDIVSEITAQFMGVQVSETQLTATLHHDPASTRMSALRLACKASLPQLPGYEVQTGRDSVEFRPIGMNRGLVVREFLRHPVFAGRALIYLGGDLSDEQAFKRVNRAHGCSVRIGHREPTQARYSLPDAPATQVWLGQMVTTLGADRSG